MHKRAREHKSIVRFEKAYRKWKQRKQLYKVQFQYKSEIENEWKCIDLQPGFIPDFVIGPKEIKKMI